jgi:ubiquinone/menaquinone biosynthesis C-methylase UbiE
MAMDLTSLPSAAGGRALPYGCPHCRRAAFEEEGSYVCGACARRFPVRGGLANFLSDACISDVGAAERSARDRQARQYESGRLREKGRLYYRMHGHVVSRLLKGAPPGPLLDAGSGTGLITQELCGRGRDIMALDFSEASLDVLAEKALPGVTPVLGSVTAIPAVDASFPAVHCSGVLQALPAGERALTYAEFARCLEPGGMLVVVAWNEAFYRAQGEPVSGRFGSGIPYFSFTREELAREARAAGLTDISIRPFGLALHIQVLPGGRYLFPTVGKLLHPVESWVHPLLPADRDYGSEYWLMVARKRA